MYAAVALALQTFYPLPAWRGGAGPLAWLAVLVLCLQVRWAGKGGALLQPVAACCCCLQDRRPPTTHPLPPSTGCPQETVDKTHYSVDMWLAVTLTALVWRCRAHVYPESERWAERPAGAPRDPFPVGMVAVVLGVLTLVFVGVAGT